MKVKVSGAHLLPTLLLSDEERSKCLLLASPSPDRLDVDIDESGSLHIRVPCSARSAPATAVPLVMRPRQAANVQPDITDPTRHILNGEQWLAHLTALKYAERRKAAALHVCWPDHKEGLLFSKAARWLWDLINELRSHLQRLRTRAAGGFHSNLAAWREMRTLQLELRDAQGNAAVREVAERVDRKLRGNKVTRSQKRAAFKRSTYGYKGTKFRGTFSVEDPETEERIRHAPQLPDLADEVSATTRVK